MKNSSGTLRVTIFLPFILSLIFISIFPAHAQLPVIKNGDRLESPFTSVYEKVAPTVVTINVKGEVASQRPVQNPWEFFFNIPRERQQQPYKGMGSGVITGREGYILTNNHVIESPDKSVVDKINVTLYNEKEYEAEVIGRDPETDLAVIKIKLDGKTLPSESVAELGDSDTIKPGDYAIAIGNPLGFDSSVTVGVISAVGRYEIRPRGAEQLVYKDYIQTDAQINPGNSGGALVDIEGKVIGINDIYAAGFAGIGFAIPINLAKNVMNQLIERGEVTRGFVGIKVADVTDEFMEALDLPGKEGAFIHEVLADSPAEDAGLERGDVIVSINGEKIKNSNEFLFKVAEITPGTKTQFGVIHKGKIKSVNLTLTDRSKFMATEVSENTVNWRGIHVSNISRPLSEKYNLGDIDSGVVVITIDSESPALETSLAVGDVILEINYEMVKNVDDFLEIKKENKDSKKPILIFRKRVTSSGRVVQALPKDRIRGRTSRLTGIFRKSEK